MLRAASLNDLLQLDADMQQARASLADTQQGTPTPINVAGNLATLLEGLQSRVRSLIDAETAVTLQALQAENARLREALHARLNALQEAQDAIASS
jgi:hypothetical protein